VKKKEKKKKNETQDIMPEKEISKDSDKTEGESDDLVKMVMFSLDQEIYGITIDQVVEIDRTMEITVVPDVPDFILGLIDLRGEIVPVVDPEKKFLLKRETPIDKRHIIICRARNGLFGMVVDEVFRILSFPRKEIDEAPALIKNKIHEDYLKGVGVLNDRVFVILDTEKILKPEELEKIKSTQ